MKKTLISIVAILFISSAFLLIDDPKPTIAIGETAPMPDLKMKDVSGKELSINDIKDKNGALVIFSCNTCPFVIGNSKSEGWEGRYNEMAELARSAEVGIVFINSNEAKRDKGDSYEDMVQRAKAKSFTMPYVIDNNHVMADAFGAKTTPHVFLFNNELKLVYKGAIDDNNESSARVKEHWLENALDQLSKNEKVDPATTRNIGCSIKRIKS